MRQCPTPESAHVPRPLITHQVTPCQCLDRQAAYYHKCVRCTYRGKPLDFVPAAGETQIRERRRNGAPRTEEVVEIPVLEPAARTDQATETAVPAAPVVVKDA